MEAYWQPGQTVTLRDTGHFVGEVWAMPMVVVQDTDDLVALFRPEGTAWVAWQFGSQEARNLPATRMNMLRLMSPGRSYALELFYAGPSGRSYEMFEGKDRFRGWKVNIEAPLRRTEIGFDTTDEFIDVYVMPDKSRYWAYGSDMEFWLRHGAYTESDRHRLIDAGLEAEALIDKSLPPFDDQWKHWHPEPDWPLPELAQGWQDIPNAEVSLGINKAVRRVEQRQELSPDID